MAGKSSANRSLSRGMLILRAFRPGSEALGNGEIAELTGLPRATVSRLTQTLVDECFLEHDRARRAYRLGAAVLGLAFSMRNSSRVLHLAENSVYALNASLTSEQAREQIVARLRKPLLDLASAIARAL